MASVNKVILIGNVGKEPEVRCLDNDVRVASFPLATTERGYVMSNGTQVPDRTEWHTIIAWRNLADTAEKYIHKSTRLYVEGKLRTRVYDSPTTGRRYITEVYAENIQFLSPVMTAAQLAQQQQAQQAQTQQPAEPQQPVMQEPQPMNPEVQETEF